MTHPPPPAPAERFASILRWLSRAVVAQTLGGPLSQLLIGFVVIRITRAIQCVEALAARIAAGTYTPRKPSTRPQDPAAARRQPPPPPSPLDKPCGWLMPLVPYSGNCRAKLEELLADPEMTALMEAAPAPIARVLRPLCWMLALDLPPALARRRRAAADPAQAAADPPPKATRKRRPRTPPPPPPPWLTPAPPRAGLGLEYDAWGRPRLAWY